MRDFVVMVFLLSLGCVQQQNKRASLREQVPSPSSQDQSVDAENLSKIEEIKELYLTLSDQLLQSEKRESQDLAELASAMGKADNSDLEEFIKSPYLKEFPEEKEAGDSVISRKETRIAAISLITFGTLSVTGGLAAFRPWNKTVAIGNPKGWAGLGVGVALLIAGHQLLENRENEKFVATSLLSTGIISTILGVGSLASTQYWHQKAKGEVRPAKTPYSYFDKIWLKIRGGSAAVLENKGTSFLDTLDHQLHDMRRLGFDNMADMITLERNKMAIEMKKPEIPFDESGFTRRKLIGGGFIALGVGFIVASQTVFNLASIPNTPYETLQKLNHLIANY